MPGLKHIPRHEAIAGGLAVIVGITLLTLKFAAYLLTGSAAIFSDACESIVNVLASFFAFYSLFLSHLPADKNHPYGHGKVEFLSAGFEGGMILLAALVIAFEAARDLYLGPKLDQADVGIYLMAAAMLVNGAVGGYLIMVGKRRGAIVLEADGYHLISDAVTSIVVILALIIYHFTRWAYIDPITALLVSFYLMYVASGLLRRSASGLMDQQDAADEELLVRILDAHTRPENAGGKAPRICSYHKLRHRHSGRYHWIDFHIMLPPHWDIARGHQIASALEKEIEAALGEGDATAHIEPCNRGDCTHCHG